MQAILVTFCGRAQSPRGRAGQLDSERVRSGVLVARTRASGRSLARGKGEEGRTIGETVEDEAMAVEIGRRVEGGEEGREGGREGEGEKGREPRDARRGESPLPRLRERSLSARSGRCRSSSRSLVRNVHLSSLDLGYCKSLAKVSTAARAVVWSSLSTGRVATTASAEARHSCAGSRRCQDIYPKRQSAPTRRASCRLFDFAAVASGRRGRRKESRPTLTSSPLLSLPTPLPGGNLTVCAVDRWDTLLAAARPSPVRRLSHRPLPPPCPHLS